MGSVAVVRMSACCPDGAYGNPPFPGYTWNDKGVVDQVGDLKVYRTGAGNKCIIWCYDIYGFEGGRTRQLCDQLADCGYLVLLPDFPGGVEGSGGPRSCRVAWEAVGLVWTETGGLGGENSSLCQISWGRSVWLCWNLLGSLHGDKTISVWRVQSRCLISSGNNGDCGKRPERKAI